MSRTTPRARWAGVAAVGALVLAGTTAAPALAGTGAGAARTTAATAAAAPELAATTEVTLFMKAPHPAALARLAATPVTDRAQRLRQLARLVPSESAQHTLVSRLSAAGLTMQSATAWSVTATAPASVISGLFGARPASGPLASGPLPIIPAALSTVVSGVFPTVGGPAVFHHHVTTTLAGADFRNADTPALVKPSTGAKDAKNTVATLQLANFTTADLSNYAKMFKLKDPVASGAYKTVTVNGGPSTSDDASGGDVEVDLDQESILSTAPSAHQHAYFAPNTNAGFMDVFASVYDDAVGNSHATQKDPHLTSMSSSWGECEGAYGAAAINALEPVIASVVAAGVTVFASAGDDGIYDCRSTTMTGLDNSQADVDFPASSPFVVSTGGSNLVAASSRANTGVNWDETAWGCGSAFACQNAVTGTGGGGGGESGSAFGATEGTTTSDFKGFPMPVYQKKTLTGIYRSQKNRLVPDIAADADPSSGFVVYTSDPMYEVLGGGGSTLTVGGTSLASPISAAQLANTLADKGVHHGVGDIHGALYSALVRTKKYSATSKHRAFRDITSGDIGAAADKGIDPSVSAAKGYDTVSGAGGVLWSALDPFLLDTAAPTPVGHFFLRHKNKAGKSLIAVARWHTERGKDTIVLDTTYVRISKVGSSNKVSIKLGHGLSGKVRFTAKRGAKYRITLLSTDISGHRSKKVMTTVLIPFAKHRH